jgi:putative redox protein
MSHQIDASQLELGSVLISPRAGGKYTLDVKTNAHTIPADEPANVGGANTGPSPYEFLLSGLGTCTALTLKAYADYKGLDLGDYHIALSKHRDENKKLVIDKELIFHGDWSSEQIEKFVEVSKKCSMHRDLVSSGISINTHVHAHN